MEQNRNNTPSAITQTARRSPSPPEASPPTGISAAVGEGTSAAQPGRGTLYRIITDRIVAELEAGRVPWVQPWRSGGACRPTMPVNAATGRPYRGINVLMLWAATVERGYACQRWLTFRQALSLGGAVRKGERSTMVVFVDRFVTEEERRRAADTGEDARTTAFLKQYSVFNMDQCEGFADPDGDSPAPEQPVPMEPWMEALVGAMGVAVRMGGDRACYHRSTDSIDVPPPSAFHEPVNWYRTVLHELAHATGHKDRLARDLTGWFGSAQYAREELVAELTAAFLCATLGTVPTVRHADYIGSWLQVLRADERAIVRAASLASNAADYMLSFLPGRAAAG